MGFIKKILGIDDEPKPFQPGPEVSLAKVTHPSPTQTPRRVETQAEVLEAQIDQDEGEVEEIEEEDEDEDDLSPRLLEAPTIEDCLDVYYEAPADSELEVKAIEKAFSLASTLEDYRAILEVSNLDAEFESRARDKVYEIQTTRLREAQSVDEFFEIADDAEDDVELDEDDIERALSLAISSEDCDTVYDRAQDAVCDEDLLNRIDLRKITFLTEVSECEDVWNDQGTDSLVGEAAICRASDIIRLRESSEASG